MNGVTPITTVAERCPHAALHRSLLVATAGLAIASVIPGSRHIASQLLRSAAWISSAAVCADSWEKEDLLHRIFNIGRVGIVTLGIVGIAATKPALYVASLAAEVGLQTFQAIKAFYDRDYERGLIHLSILVVDTLMLAAVVTGAWQVMVTAAAVNVGVMTLFFFKLFAEAEKRDSLMCIDAFCYLALAFVSGCASIQASRHDLKRADSAHVNIKNDKESLMEVYDSEGRRIFTLKPGEQVVLDHKYAGNQELATLRIDDGTHIREYKPPQVHYQRYWTSPNLFPKDYHTAPVGGTIVADRQMI